jgi:hypothetical protein
VRNTSQIAKHPAALAAVLAGGALAQCANAQNQRPPLPPHNEQGRVTGSQAQQSAFWITMVTPPGPGRLLAPPPTEDGPLVLGGHKPTGRWIPPGPDGRSALLPWSDGTRLEPAGSGGVALPPGEVPTPGAGVVLLLAASAAASRRRR